MRFIGKWIAMLLLASAAYGQDVALFTEDFPPEEFRSRREGVYDAIGANALALIQGAPSPPGYVRFRQSNSFYYLSGVESPHAYLLLDSAERETRLYLPHRNPGRERSEGKLLSAEDDELTRELTGVDAVYGIDILSEHLARFASRGRVPALYTPFKPAEGAAMSRDLATRGGSDIANDPWDGRPTREAHFLNRIRERFPQLAVHDLSSILDQMRLVKSPREIELIRKATRLSGLALMEAMRSTTPGMMEYELDALAKFIFFREGAQSDAYYSLIAGGPNAWYPHYHRGGRDLRAGELLLMDYAPDVGYYASDVTRMWPVDGRFNAWQRDLYGFYLAYYTAILDAIRPGDVNAIMTEAATTMDEIDQMTAISRRGSLPSPSTAMQRSVLSTRTGSVRIPKGHGPRASDTAWGWRSTTSASTMETSSRGWCSPSSLSSGFRKNRSTSASRTLSLLLRTAPRICPRSSPWIWTASKR